MKFTIERAPFIKALSHIQSIVDRRNTIPILSNVKIEAGRDIILTATDLDIYAVETVPASITDQGAITVSAHLLHDIAKKMPDGAQISVEAKDGKLIIKAGRSRFTLPTIPVDDYPVFPFQADVTFTMAGDDLISAIDKTRFAMSSEETRYYLNGLFWHSKDGLTIAATDGHRLSTHVIRHDTAIPDIIVPRKAINEVRKLVSGGNVTVDIGNQKIRFTVDHVTLASKLIDGTFPDYTRVIPKNNPNLLTVDANAMRLALDRVATVASDKTKGVKLTLTHDTVTVSIVSPDNGAASEDIACQYSGTVMEIGFNSSYLKDILSQFDGAVSWEVGDPNGPCLIGGAYVLMPMRV